MRHSPRSCLVRASLVLALFAAPPAFAADPATEAIQAAYAPYRAALFRTNGSSLPEARQALAEATGAWGAVTTALGVSPPTPHAGDTRWRETLDAVTQTYARARQQVEAGQLPQAHETLEGIRDLLADLRRRNGVIVFSDHMNAYHAAMETLLEAGPQVLEGPKAFPELMARAGVLEYLAQRLLSEAPASLAGQPEFVARQRAVADAVAALRRAALAQDRDAAAAALKALKGPYSRLFLAFG